MMFDLVIFKFSNSLEKLLVLLNDWLTIRGNSFLLISFLLIEKGIMAGVEKLCRKFTFYLFVIILLGSTSLKNGIKKMAMLSHMFPSCTSGNLCR